jgi:pimeloyl-ACP methyl ester carboxylesterase
MMEKQDVALLFLPGAGGTAAKWRRVNRYFSRYPCIFADLPGHGANEAAVLKSIAEHAAHFSPLITRNTIVIGHSMGGLIALELAASHPRVIGLVLAASHYALPVDAKLFDKLASGVYPDGLFYASYSKKADPGLLAEERGQIDDVPLQTTIIDYRCCNEYQEGIAALSKLRKPILAIYGADDRMLPSAAKEELSRAAPHAEIETIPDAGHYPMLEQAEQFANILLRFVQRVTEKEVKW